MSLRNYNPYQAKNLIFFDPQVSLKDLSGPLPNTQDGLLYVMLNRKGNRIYVARFDPVTGNFLETSHTGLDWHLDNQEYQGPLASKIQKYLENNLKLRKVIAA